MPRAPSPWIDSPAWDVVFIFSGLWAPLLLMLGYTAVHGASHRLSPDTPSVHDAPQLFWLFSALSVLHRLSSIYTVVVSPVFKSELSSNPRRYVYVPLAILVGCIVLSFAFVFHPLFAFTSTLRGQLWAFFVLASVMILWERWHFCAQEFGVLSIYRARTQQFAPADRRFDRWYVVALMLGVNMVMYVCLGFRDEREVLFYGTALAHVTGPILDSIAAVACALAMALMTWAVARELRHQQRSLPKLAFYVLVGSHSLVLYLYPRALGLFFMCYVFHHWMVAIGLFNRITLNSYTDARGFRRLGRYVTRVGPFLVFALLCELFFAPLNVSANLTPLPSVTSFEGASIAARVSAALVIGALFAFNFLHYYYDRCMYSFSMPGVRKAVVPLLFGMPASEPQNDARPVANDRQLGAA